VQTLDEFNVIVPATSPVKVRTPVAGTHVGHGIWLGDGEGLAAVPPPHAVARSRQVRRAHLVKVDGEFALLDYVFSLASRSDAGL
jgi:hypothetical protein